MPILLILLLTLACLPDSWPRPGSWIASPGVSVTLTWAAAGLLIGFAYLLSGRIRHHLEKETMSRSKIVKSYYRGRRYHLFGLIGAFLLALYVLGYGWGLHEIWQSNGELLPAVDVILLAPFIVALLLSWAAFYGAEEALEHFDDEDGFKSRWSYVVFHARQNLALVILPLLLLLVEKELRRQIPAWRQLWDQYGSALGVILALILFLIMPWLLRLVLGLKPLEQGPLRARLEAASQRVGFRCSNILVWHTRNGVANAMVVGALPFLRYVLLSDRLLEDLTDEEVEAVFGHEIGHIKHHHMLLYLGFLMASIFSFGLLLNPYLPELTRWLHLEGRQDLAAIPIVVALGSYIFLVFGFLSRRCERQADIFGCRTVSCRDFYCHGHQEGVALAPRGQGLCSTGIRVFCAALEKVGIINGVNREKPGFFQSWQHSTIARRVEFLQNLEKDPKQESRFQRRVLLLKWSLFVILGGVALMDMIIGS